MLPGITQKDLDKIRSELDSCTRPLFLFDDDPDGFCSFMLLYRYKKEGHGIVVKKKPLDSYFIPKVIEYAPDKIFILDIPRLDESFVKQSTAPIVWIDHHQHNQKLPVHVTINPCLKDHNAYVPVSAICCEAVGQDYWLGALGSISDAYVPPFLDKVAKEYPDLIPDLNKSMEDFRYNTPFGLVITIVSFFMKDAVSRIKKIIPVFTRLKDPHEILDRHNPSMDVVYQSYDMFSKVYLELIKSAESQIKQLEDRTLIYFEYENNTLTVTSDLCNELFYHNPDSLVMVARKKDGQLKMSLRYHGDLLSILEPVVQKLNASGGGHPHACGATVQLKDRDLFLSFMRDHTPTISTKAKKAVKKKSK